MEARLPNFLIVGAAKSGTTSLYQYLKQHPEIYMPKEIKEPCFMVSSIYKHLSPNDPRYKQIRKSLVFTFEDYAKLFEDVQRERAIGEASIPYLYYYETAISQIEKYLGNIKIIIILRNPIDRAFSAHNFLLMNQAEVLSFEECLKREEERKKENWVIMHFYKDVGFYYKQVKAYRENFNQVKILLFDDLKNDTLRVVKDIYAFLDVNTFFVPDMQIKYNVSGIPKYKFIHNFLIKQNLLKTFVKPIMMRFIPGEKRIKLKETLMMKNFGKPQMRPETREYLKNLYREDILNLQGLIHRDLSHWLQ